MPYTSLRSILSYIGNSALLSQFTFNKPFTTNNGLSTAPPFTFAPTCPIEGPLSCHNNTYVSNSCCFIYPGGQLLQTQFWDTNPSVGPGNSWTIHGLWPDLCDGTYDQFCTSAPQYTNITDILSNAGQSDLLDFMNSYWLPNQGTKEKFWEHEWNKHGTCINTLNPDCYGDAYEAGTEVVDFFTRTVALFKTLDTFTALANAGIVPSRNKKYVLADILDALSAVTGSAPVVGCQRGVLNEVWYTYNVKGSLQTGEFVATDPAGTKGASCPARGIRYLPK